MGITVPVDIHDAFSHLFVLGLASIVEEERPGTHCMLSWQGIGDSVTISTTRPMGIDDFAQCVQTHAQKYNGLLAMQSEGKYDGKTNHATMSPRLSNIVEPTGWKLLAHDRQAAMDALATIGEVRYFGALGQPSYWSGRNGNPPRLYADGGASRWEMVTRNKGQEFIQGRLRALSETVAAFSQQRISDGLTGRIEQDELGGKPDSRTGTGLHHPQITDNARAWCALIGVNAFPVVPGEPVVSKSQTGKDPVSAMFQLKRLGIYAILPVFDGAWTLQRYRSVVRNAALCRAVADVVALKKPQINDEWLSERHVIACVVFTQYVSDNASAPERWLERGHFFEVAPTSKR